MVQAIIQDRKTQTRRVIKPQPSDNWMQNVFSLCPTGNMYRRNGEQMFWLSDGKEGEIKCPYGKVGDLLWVRETFIDAEDYPCHPFHDEESGVLSQYDYKADCPVDEIKNIIWKPSIFMPKAAARIWLEITNIKVERLQDISEEDAKAEGISRIYNTTSLVYKNYLHSDDACNAYKSFQTLWQSINGSESWDANPWVWVIEFKRINIAA